MGLFRRKGLKIFGCSDDLVELRGVVDNEIGCFDEDVKLRIGTERKGLYVTMKFGRNNTPTWSMEIEQIDENIPIPWDCLLGQYKSHYGNTHSPLIHIDGPARTTVMRMEDGRAQPL